MRINTYLLSALILFGLGIHQSAAVNYPAPACPALSANVEPAHMAGTFYGKDGWLFRPSKFEPDYSGWAESYQLITEALRKVGITLVLPIIPTRSYIYADKLPDGVLSDTEYQKTRQEYLNAIAELQSIGVISPNLWDPLVAHKNDGDVFYRRDHHWTALGAKTAADVIGAAIRQDTRFPGTDLTFETQPAGRDVAGKSLAAAIEDYCGPQSFGDEYVQIFKTAQQGGDGGGDLFGDAPTPQIVVTGTSFSAKSNGEDWYDFLGRLSEATGEEALNFSVNAGGNETAILKYLTSESFQDSPPTYLIWEQSSATSPRMPSDMVSQIVGTMSGSCENTSLAQVRIQGTGDFAVNASRPFSGPGYIMELTYDDPTVRRVKVTFVDNRGRQVRNRLVLPSRLLKSIPFFVELPRTLTNVASVSIVPQDVPDATATVTFCASDLSPPAQVAQISLTPADTNASASAAIAASNGSAMALPTSSCRLGESISIGPFESGVSELPLLGTVDLATFTLGMRNLGCHLSLTGYSTPSDPAQLNERLAMERVQAVAEKLAKIGFVGTITLNEPKTTESESAAPSVVVTVE